MTDDPNSGGGQASRLAVAAIVLAVVFAAMALIGPLLTPGVPGESRLPPLIQVLAAR
jgi:hypothetical protein